MSASSKSKTLRVERLENRELMASNVGHWLPTEIEGFESAYVKRDSNPVADLSKSVRLGLQADSGRDALQTHGLSRDDRPIPNSAQVHERPKFNAVVLVHIPPVRQVFFVLEVQPTVSLKENMAPGYGNANGVKTKGDSDQYLTESARQGLAEGEGDSPKVVRGIEAEHVHEFRGAVRALPLGLEFVLGTDVAMSSIDDTEVFDDGSEEVRWGSSGDADGEILQARFRMNDGYFAELGGGTKEKGEDDIVRGAFLDSAAVGIDSADASEILRKVHAKNEVTTDLKWDYLVVSAIADDGRLSDLSETKQHSLFEVYSPSQHGVESVSTAAQDPTKLIKAAADRVEEVNALAGDLFATRYWVLSLAIASAWIGFQQQRSRTRWALRMNSMKQLPRYFKKRRDKR
jgi:hypothetical protein